MGDELQIFDCEQWRDIAGYEGAYQVSDMGRVRGADRTLPDGRLWKGRILNFARAKRAHLRVQLCNGVLPYKYFLVHRLVLEAFSGPCPDGMIAAHNNGNPRDNRITNLRWSTPSDNHIDMWAHGTICAGNAHSNSKLTERQVEKIFRMRQSGALLREIAAEMGVTVANISYIVRGERWKHAYRNFQ